MGCKKNDFLYKSVSEEFDALFEHIKAALSVKRTVFIDEAHIYITLTAGAQISRLSEELFAKGEGLAGLIVNNCADDVLFAADDMTAVRVKYICAEIGKGIKERREAPADIPISQQAVILDKAPLEGVSITEGFMLSPVKSMGYELILSDDDKIFRAQHDCASCPNKTCPRRTAAPDKDFEVVSDFEYKPSFADGVAVDIGTTTIAAVRLEKGRIAAAYSEINNQRRFGADVLSRIEAASRGRGDELRSVVEYQLDKCLKAIGGREMRTVISANTTMVSLLMGYDCSGLGRYPFTAENLDSIHKDNMSITGGISAFVGGDITSGLYMCGFDENEEINLFVDLGTNGEMAIGNCRRILCTSTAAGPAFEGGRISCGTGSVEGAICAVSIKENLIETIGAKEPCGICGTGIVELAAELAESGYIDKTGLYSEEYAAGYEVAKGIVFTQKDVRELQTAKAAVRAGIEILLEEYGADENEIRNVYIAGGFGKRLNIEKACRIGLLPRRFAEKYKAVGNSSLGGCVKLLENDDGFECIDRIRSVSEDFPLAEKESFTEMFIKYMEFY
ncbi:MAG: ASKHA domain-containing protein [Candidatus Ornithomonoglobus sp.]